MEDIFTQLKKAQTVTMTDAERSAIRHTLVNISTSGPSTTQGQVSPYARSFSFMSIMTKATVFAVVGFIIGSTSLAFASLKALPGDSLYAIKTNVTEKIATAFTFGTEAKARIAANHLTNRIREIQAVRETGAIKDTTIATKTETAFSESFATYTTSLNKLRDEGRVARSQEIATATLASIKTVAPEPQAPAAAMMMSAKSSFMATEPAPEMKAVTMSQTSVADMSVGRLDAVLSQAVIASEAILQIDTEASFDVQAETSEQDIPREPELEPATLANPELLQIVRPATTIDSGATANTVVETQIAPTQNLVPVIPQRR